MIDYFVPYCDVGGGASAVSAVHGCADDRPQICASAAQHEHCAGCAGGEAVRTQCCCHPHATDTHLPHQQPGNVANNIQSVKYWQVRYC